MVCGVVADWATSGCLTTHVLGPICCRSFGFEPEGICVSAHTQTIELLRVQLDRLKTPLDVQSTFEYAGGFSKGGGAVFVCAPAVSDG